MSGREQKCLAGEKTNVLKYKYFIKTVFSAFIFEEAKTT